MYINNQSIFPFLPEMLLWSWATWRCLFLKTLLRKLPLIVTTSVLSSGIWIARETLLMIYKPDLSSIPLDNFASLCYVLTTFPALKCWSQSYAWSCKPVLRLAVIVLHLFLIFELSNLALDMRVKPCLCWLSLHYFILLLKTWSF